MNYLTDRKDLSVGFLDFVGLVEEVPESRFSVNLVGGEDSHFPDLGVFVVIAGGVSSDNEVLVNGLGKEEITFELGLLWDDLTIYI